MKRTKEEVDLLINEAKKYEGKVWKTLGKEFKFISAGNSFATSEKVVNDISSKPMNYQVIGIKLETKDGEKLPKTLEQIIEHFKNNS